MSNRKKEVSSKLSIRKKIAFSYGTMFLISALAIIIVTSSCFLYQAYTKIEADRISIITKIDEDYLFFKENKSELSELLSNKKITSLYIYNRDKNLIISMGEKIPDIDHLYLENSGYKLNYIRKGFIYNISLVNGSYYVVTYYSIKAILIEILLVARWISTAYIVCFLLFITVGLASTKKILNPLVKMTQTTKMITAQNLDLRIDVLDASYELKELAQTTNEMIDRLQTSYQKQQRFVSDVSHELRTPISVILGYGNLLKRWGKEDSEILDEGIESIINESKNMQDLVEKLLFLARYDKETLKYDFSIVNFSEMVRDIIKETDMVDDEHIIKGGVEDDLYIYADHNRVKEMARIFADNALKYTPNDGVVEIKLLKEENFACLVFKDNGIGIQYKDLGNIFNRFYRADESRTREKGGHGLGLSIAKAIVLDHKGYVKVRSKEGKGSEFYIYIPIIENIK